MSEIWGIDCTRKDCVHDTVVLYRMFLFVRYGQRPPGISDAGWEEGLRDRWVPERNAQISGVRGSPAVYYPPQLEAAYEDLEALGAERKLGTQDLDKDRAINLPAFCEARRIRLLPERARRVAIYFRYRPELGEILTADRAFQCHFPAGATAAERALAPEVQLTSEQFHTILRRVVPGAVPLYTRDTLINCQHCQRPLPLRAMNTLTLREVAKGD